MNPFDPITRRDFLSRVTTLAGGAVVATSAGLLAGCGSDNSSSTATKSTPFPSLPAAPSAVNPSVAIANAVAGGVLPAGFTYVGGVVKATITDTSLAAVTALLLQYAPSVSTWALPTVSYGVTTAAAQGITQSQADAALSSWLAQSGITFVVGETIQYLTYAYNGQSYNSVAVIASNGAIVFDSFCSLLAPTSKTTHNQSNVSNDRTNKAVGQARYTSFNLADGHLLLDFGYTSTPNYDVNGNLNQTTPATVAQVGTGTAGPGITLGSSSGSIKLNSQTPVKVSNNAVRPHDLILSISITVSYTVGGVSFSVSVTATIDVSATSITTTTAITITETFAGIVIFSVSASVSVTISFPTGLAG